MKYTNEEEKMIKVLEKSIADDDAPKITQERFDEIVDYLIKEKKDELIWRLCVTYYKYNHHKVIDYYILNRDVCYIEELVSIIAEHIDQEYVVKKMLETKDKEFIKSALAEAGNDMHYSLQPHLLEKLLDYVK